MTFLKSPYRIFILIIALLPKIHSRIFPKCELGRELQERYNFPKEDISKWLCLVQWESGFDTTALNKGAIPNSFDHGIFQINDFNWCQSLTRPSENRCKVPCENLRDEDITDDVQCLRIIMQQRGFDEWMSHPLRCSADTGKYYEDCQLTKRDLKLGLRVPKETKVKLGIDLTTQPKGLKVRVSTPEARFRLISKLIGGHLRIKPFFNVHQYITK